MRKLFVLPAVLVLLCLGTVFSYASAASVAINPVSDYAGMLTEDEERVLADGLEYIRETYASDAAVVTVPDLEGKSAQDYADDFLDYNGYGIGSDSSGILLLISEEPRRYHITTSGRCFDIFNDAAIDYMCGNVEAELRNDRYYEACAVFAEDCKDIFESYAAGESYEPPKSIGLLIAMLGTALVLAVIITAVAGSTMKDAKLQVNADLYAEGRSVKLKSSRDIFLYSSVTRTPIPKSNSGGSTGHVSSSGRVHGGGGGSY